MLASGSMTRPGFARLRAARRRRSKAWIVFSRARVAKLVIATRGADVRGLLAGRGLTFLEAEGDEAVGRIVGRETNGDAVARDHANPESAHPARELGRHHLAVLERDLIAPTAENLVDASGRLNQVITCQIDSVLLLSPRAEGPVSEIAQASTRVRERRIPQKIEDLRGFPGRFACLNRGDRASLRARGEVAELG